MEIFDAPFINQLQGADRTGITIAQGPRKMDKHEEGVMTKEKWLLLGALILSILVVLYLEFFCPSECH